ncbi:MAG: hemolysin family protein, partial [Alkalibacterium sp.]
MNSDPWSIQPFIGPLAVIIGLIIVHAFFSAAEIAMVSINPNRMMEESLDGSKKAKRILRILDNADEFLTTIQVGMTLSALFTSGMTVILLMRLGEAAESQVLSSNVFILFVTAILLTYLLLSFGEKLPKAIAKQNPDEIAKKLSGMVLGLRYLSIPIVWLVNMTVRGLKKVLPIDFLANDETITRDEFRSFIEHSHQHEVIDIDEFSMLKGVLSLDNKIAREVMVPRTDAFMLDYDDPNEENIEAMLETPHSRVPLYFEDKDNILGIVHVKNLLQASKHKPLYSI